VFDSLKRFLAAFAVITFFTLSLPVRASLGTNFSDQWWNPAESGWGAAILQQYDTLFVDVFVYGPDGRPTWYTAAAYYQGLASVRRIGMLPETRRYVANVMALRARFGG